MKTFAHCLAAAAVSVALGLSAGPASAQLLGGLLGGDGGDGGLVDGLLGDGGTVDNLLGGNGDGDVDIPGVLTLDAGTSDPGTNVLGTILGGGGGDIDIPLGDILGGDSGINLVLPDIGGVIGSPGTPGLPGEPGKPGIPGVNGVNGTGINGVNGRNGIGGTKGRNGINGVNSSRLRMLLAVLQNRAWLRFAQGNKVCLPAFGVANVGSWVSPSEYGQLQQLLATYSGDIAMLQQMMKNCRNGQNRMVDLGRVIGVDLRPNGQLVVMTI